MTQKSFYDITETKRGENVSMMKNKIIEEIVISQNEIIIKNKLRNYEYILVNLEELN